jgi:hypothetical protein
MEVNKLNEERLNEIEGEVIELTAINIHPMIKSYQPHVNKDGSIKDTPLLSVVKLKENSRVMITYNVNLSDGIVNGLGTVREFVYHSPENSVQAILIEFDDTDTGRKARQCANWQDNLTSVTRISFEYTVGTKLHKGLDFLIFITLTDSYLARYTKTNKNARHQT